MRVQLGRGGGPVLRVDGAEGAVDLEQAEHGGGAGAALQPDHDGRLGRVHVLKERDEADETARGVDFALWKLTVAGKNQKKMLLFVALLTVINPE